MMTQVAVNSYLPHHVSVPASVPHFSHERQGMHLNSRITRAHLLPPHRAAALQALPRQLRSHTLFPNRLSKQIREWRRICADRSVLRIVKEGLRIQFFRDVHKRTPGPQFMGTQEQMEHLAVQLDKWLTQGIISEATEPPLVESLLFPVKKPGPKRWRWCLDARYVNRHESYQTFRMTGLPVVRQMLRQRDWLTSIDLEDAFHHVKLTRQAQRYLAFRAMDKVYTFRAMLFGLSSAPRVFTALLRPVIKHLHRLGIRVVSYLDDLLIASATYQQSLLDYNRVEQTLTRLGFKLNQAKCESTPTQHIRFLGFNFNTRSFRMSVPADKVKQIRQHSRRILAMNASGSLTPRLLAGFVGKLVAASPVLQPLLYRRRSLHRCIAFALRHSVDCWNEPLSLSRTAVRDAMWLANTPLWTWNGVPIRHRLSDQTAVLTTDASLTGWGAVLTLPDNTSHQLSAPWSRWEIETHRSINTLEARAVLLAWDRWRHLLAPWRDLLVECDNMTTVAYLRRFGGPFRHLAEIVEPIQLWCLQQRILLRAVHLPGEKNQIADLLSRQHSPRHPAHEWSISDEAFRALTDRWGQPTIDWFASPWTTQCHRFVTLDPCRSAVATDAFRCSWSGRHERLSLLVPPFPLIERVVAKALDDNASAVIVVPVWPTRPFWATLTRFCSEMMLLSPTALKPPQGVPVMRDWRPPQLAAFRLTASSDAS
jgi:hypothetical protein